MTEKLYTRREAAKKLGISVQQLKGLEAQGIAVPMRDEKRRFRYSGQQIETLKAFVASQAANMAGVQPPQPLPPPTAPQPPPVAPLPPPQASIPQPLSQLYAVPPLPLEQPISTAGIGAIPPELPRGEAALWNCIADDDARKEVVWRLSAVLGADPGRVLTDLSNANVTIPPQLEEVLRNCEEVSSCSAQQMWASLREYFSTAPPYSPPAVKAAPPIHPAPMPPAPMPVYAPAPPLGYAPPVYPPQYAQPRPQRPAPQPVAPQQQLAGYGYPYQQFAPSPVAAPTGPVQAARDELAVAQIEVEKERLAQQTAQVEQARLDAVENQRRHDLAIAESTARGEAQAAAELERLKQLEAVTALRGLEDAKTRQLALEEQARQREQVQTESRHKEEMAQAVNATIGRLIMGLPAEIPANAVADIRIQIDQAVAGMAPTDAITIAKSICDRAAEPYLQATRQQALREEIFNNVGVMEQFNFSALGQEAVAAAQQATKDFLSAATVNDDNFNQVVIETRHARDQALQPYRDAAEAQAAEIAARQEVEEQERQAEAQAQADANSHRGTVQQILYGLSIGELPRVREALKGNEMMAPPGAANALVNNAQAIVTEQAMAIDPSIPRDQLQEILAAMLHETVGDLIAQEVPAQYQPEELADEEEFEDEEVEYDEQMDGEEAGYDA